MSSLVPRRSLQAMASTTSNRAERRWPMALAVIAAIALQIATPKRGRVPGWWVFPVLELVLLVLLVVVDPGRVDDRSLKARRITAALVGVMTVGVIGGVFILLEEIVNSGMGEDLTATDLLGRGGALWLSNVIVFSLWFWLLDRGGPAERAARSGAPASFAFPENATPELAPDDWMPAYPDYLYLAFTNATAFSPTDTLPVRTWAKMALMLQSVISLLTAILVVARAINVLPS
jgi:uncharacterized membrane protein